MKDPAHKTPGRAPPPVRLVVPAEPVRVNYETVRALVPTLWDDPARRYDLVLHIGMAGPPVKYSVERRAHRDGYKFRDVDGNLLGDEERRAREGDGWVWAGAPEELLTDLDVDDIYKRWVARCPVRISPHLRVPNPASRHVRVPTGYMSTERGGGAWSRVTVLPVYAFR